MGSNHVSPWNAPVWPSSCSCNRNLKQIAGAKQRVRNEGRVVTLQNGWGLVTVAGTRVINHSPWQSDKRCCEADWEKKLLWRVCDAEEALTTCVNKGHCCTDADPNIFLCLNLPWKAITATQLGSAWPSPPLSRRSSWQRNSLSAEPRWPLIRHSEMSSTVWEQAFYTLRRCLLSRGPSAGQWGTSKLIYYSIFIGFEHCLHWPQKRETLFWIVFSPKDL